ncbi:MAG: UDP-N-acetylglucosamine 2-epimerase (non-hydrolyzing) [Prevotellaceae bacterium]|jgi:UDP-GlcNAc3NAcA epimerase|nr:UDP-N-acetylglucosamine 2-epimerase (non-hydrolyzing) [Prevotellaceae bacterium]
MIKILTVIGARPQIIKAAALSRAVNTHFSDRIEEKILHTGQHYDSNMSDVFFQEMNIPQPHFNLNIGSGTHGEQTARMIKSIEQVLLEEAFDAAVLFGDTNSTLAGAVAASKIHVPVVHIEAGLRSFNMAMPEEVNRIVCDQLSTMLFAPTKTAMQNLENEGFFTSQATFADGNKRHIFNSGDIMYDNTLYYASMSDKKTAIVSQLGLNSGEYILATVHRDNNTDNPKRLTAIFEALLAIAEQKMVEIVIPVHPRTYKVLKTNEFNNLLDKIEKNRHIRFIPPASFLEMIALEKNARIVMTDSGGVQKEAYFFGKPCVILRSETEWVEITEQHAGIVTDANTCRIVEAYDLLVDRNIKFLPVFGDGSAAEFIVKNMLEVLQDISH